MLYIFLNTCSPGAHYCARSVNPNRILDVGPYFDILDAIIEAGAEAPRKDVNHKGAEKECETEKKFSRGELGGTACGSGISGDSSANTSLYQQIGKVYRQLDYHKE